MLDTKRDWIRGARKWTAGGSVQHAKLATYLACDQLSAVLGGQRWQMRRQLDV